MTTNLSSCVGRAAVFIAIVIAAETPASAQTFVSPFVGRFDGGRAGCRVTPRRFCEPTFAGVGVSIGVLGSTVGVEGEIAYRPELLGKPAVLTLDSSMLTATGNLLVLTPIRGGRLFAVAGAGMARTTIVGSTTRRDTAWLINLGAGGIFMLRRHLGVRGDFRWFRVFDDLVEDLQVSTAVAQNSEYFFRLSGGVIVAF